MPERWKAIMHKNHGWLEAPDDFWFEERGKMVYLLNNADKDGWLTTLLAFPYGTAWRSSSIIAYADATLST